MKDEERERGEEGVERSANYGFEKIFNFLSKNRRRLIAPLYIWPPPYRE